MKGDAIINDTGTIGVNGTVWLPSKGQPLVLRAPFCFIRSDASLIGSIGSSCKLKCSETGRVWEKQDQGFIASLKGQLGISWWPSVARSSDFFSREAKHLDLQMKSPSF